MMPDPLTAYHVRNGYRIATLTVTAVRLGEQLVAIAPIEPPPVAKCAICERPATWQDEWGAYCARHAPVEVEDVQ